MPTATQSTTRTYPHRRANTGSVLAVAVLVALASLHCSALTGWAEQAASPAQATELVWKARPTTCSTSQKRQHPVVQTAATFESPTPEPSTAEPSGGEAPLTLNPMPEQLGEPSWPAEPDAALTDPVIFAPDHGLTGDGCCGVEGLGCGVADCAGACWGPGDYFCRPPWYWLCGLKNRLWVRSEYLLWWTKSGFVPPLVTTSPFDPAEPIEDQREVAGVLGEPGTSILFGGSDMADGPGSGGRIRIGYWLDPCQNVGLEASYTGLRGDSTDFYRQSTGGEPILARPFYNLEQGFEGEDAELVAFPTLLEGSIRVRGDTDFHGVELLYRRAMYGDCLYRVDFLAGWRFNRLDEGLLIQESFTSLDIGTGVPEGTTVDLFDRFDTENVFHGAELGVLAEMRRCRWTLELVMKLALGNTRSRVEIDGLTTTTVPGLPADTDHAGLLAQDTNIGVYENSDFAVIPELGITVGYDLTCRLRATFGYTFIYWSRVARPGDSVDRDLNLTQLDQDGLVGVPGPEFRWIGTDFWAQGMNFGLDYRF